MSRAPVRRPGNLRSWIGRAYRYDIQTGTHPTRSYVEAHRAALEWIREHNHINDAHCQGALFDHADAAQEQARLTLE